MPRHALSASVQRFTLVREFDEASECFDSYSKSSNVKESHAVTHEPSSLFGVISFITSFASELFS
jgi:hypothetical protein